MSQDGTTNTPASNDDGSGLVSPTDVDTPSRPESISQTESDQGQSYTHLPPISNVTSSPKKRQSETSALRNDSDHDVNNMLKLPPIKERRVLIVVSDDDHDDKKNVTSHPDVDMEARRRRPSQVALSRRRSSVAISSHRKWRKMANSLESGLRVFNAPRDGMSGTRHLPPLYRTRYIS